MDRKGLSLMVEKLKEIGVEGLLFYFLIFFVIIGFPALSVYIFWKVT